MKSYIQCSTNSEKIGLEYPNRCPICGDSIMPRMVQNFQNLKINIYSFLFECPSCGKGFLGHYESINELETYRNYKYNLLKCIGTFPRVPQERKFDDSLKSISPNFCKIYNEALFAETYGLNEIAGIGYRKALEFLIKEHPEKLEKRYDIKVEDDIVNTLNKIAISRKCYLKDDEIDEKRLYALILKDIRDNQLGAISWEKYEDGKCVRE